MAIHPKLKLGLGIGCAVVFVAVMILFGGTVYFAKQMGKDYKVVKELEQQLAEQHGSSTQLPEGFDGLPRADRMEAFLAVRAATAEWRRNVETSFAEVMARQGSAKAKGLRQFVQVMKASRDLAPVFSGFWTARNQALLDQEMGMAEYIYLYCLSYHAWLGHDPSDGALDGGEFLAGLGATGPMVSRDETQEVGDIDREKRRQWAWEQENRLMLPLLEQAAQTAALSPNPEVLIWAEQLQQEVRALRSDPQRLPFAEGLPERAGLRLEPFRAALEAAYSPAVNPVELLFEDTWEGEE